MSTNIEQREAGAMAEQVLIGGDLARLTPGQRADYYMKVCETIGLNPYTKPFDFITLNGKLTLYAKRDCTDQLRKRDGISVYVTRRGAAVLAESHDVQTETQAATTPSGVYVVTARAKTADGREDESVGAVSIAGLKGEALANALMKAETKAKRRVTLSICGLGWLDESEVESVPDARRVDVDTTTGEIIDAGPATPDLVSAQCSRKIHAMAREAFGDGEAAKANFRSLKQQLFGHTKQTTELTKAEGEALTDALQVLIDERAEAAATTNQDAGTLIDDAG